MSGTMCLYSIIYGASSGRTGMAGGNSDTQRLEPPGGFFTPMSTAGWGDLKAELSWNWLLELFHVAWASSQNGSSE